MLLYDVFHVSHAAVAEFVAFLFNIFFCAGSLPSSSFTILRNFCSMSVDTFSLHGGLNQIIFLLLVFLVFAVHFESCIIHITAHVYIHCLLVVVGIQHYLFHSC